MAEHAEFRPDDVAEAVVREIRPGHWAIWLADSLDETLDSFTIDVEGPFQPNVLDVLGPLLNERYGIAYLRTEAWDEHDGVWSATMYTYGWPNL